MFNLDLYDASITKSLPIPLQNPHDFSIVSRNNNGSISVRHYRANGTWICTQLITSNGIVKWFWSDSSLIVGNSQP